MVINSAAVLPAVDVTSRLASCSAGFKGVGQAAADPPVSPLGQAKGSGGRPNALVPLAVKEQALMAEVADSLKQPLPSPRLALLHKNVCVRARVRVCMSWVCVSHFADLFKDVLVAKCMPECLELFSMRPNQGFVLCAGAA